MVIQRELIIEIRNMQYNMRCTQYDIERLLADIKYDGQLSATAYIILAVVLLGIIAGLGWCFYRAVTARDRSAEPQSPDEVGDEKQQI